MRILFSSTRGAGHLRPLLPYLHALVQRGHEVCVTAPEGASAILQNEKLQHFPFDRPSEDALATVRAGMQGLSDEEVSRVYIRQVFADLDPRAALPKMRQSIHAWRPDLIVRESAEFAAAVAADEAGIPHARVAVHSGPSESRVIAAAAEGVDILRREAGLRPDNGAALRAAPAFTAFPASLDGEDPVGCPLFRVCGIQVPESPTSSPPAWAPQDGRPFLYISFGTEAGSSPRTQAVYRAALEAAAALPVRALLTTGPVMETTALGPIPANVTVEAWIPQDEVWRYATALVCHGGSGTMLGGLAAGLPMVVVPLFADQPQNARRITEVGAGVAVLSPDSSSLQVAIERVLSEPAMRDSARRIAVEIAAMPSIDEAVDALVALVRA